MRISDWSPDVCSSDLGQTALGQIRTAPPGKPVWVAETLESHQGLLEGIRRRFELLRTHRAWLRGQVDGDELDLDAYVDAVANLRAGSGLTDRLYRRQRCAEQIGRAHV